MAEAFVRRGFQEVFDAIRHDGVCGSDLTKDLRKQWIAQRNRKVKPFDGSPKVYMEIANEILSDVISKRVAYMVSDHLPVSGNLDANIIREVCHVHGITLHSTNSTIGGGALTTVKTKRNSLAHGDESFVEVGRHKTVADLVKDKNEVIAFLRSVLVDLETFTTAKTYRV